jgi:hypothetical protein
VDSLKRSVEVVAKSDTSCFNPKLADLTMGKITVTQMEVFFVRIAVSLVMIRKIVSNSRRRIHKSTMPDGNTDRPNFDSQDLVFTATASYERIIGCVIVEPADTTVCQWMVCTMFKILMRRSPSETATKWW